MDFNLTKEQEMIRNLVQDFAEKEIKPIADEIALNCRYAATPRRPSTRWRNWTS